jgi:glycosyltransferase involved in cell wall biosynthesis
MVPITGVTPAAPAGVARDARRLLVSVVLPVFNEAETLPQLLHRLDYVARSLASRYAFEFVLVDDGSSDRTFEAAEQLAALDDRIRVVALRRNYGQTAALQVGFEHVGGDIVISMDADLQHFRRTSVVPRQD